MCPPRSFPSCCTRVSLTSHLIPSLWLLHVGLSSSRQWRSSNICRAIPSSSAQGAGRPRIAALTGSSAAGQVRISLIKLGNTLDFSNGATDNPFSFLPVTPFYFFVVLSLFRLRLPNSIQFYLLSGADGHCASLYPNSPQVAVNKQVEGKGGVTITVEAIEVKEERRRSEEEEEKFLIGRVW